MNRSDANLRRQMIEKLSEDDIRAVCHDDFPPVYYDLTRGMTKSQIVELLLDYCRRNSKTTTLRTVLHKINPNIFLAPEPQEQTNSFIHPKTGQTFIHIPEGKFLQGEDKREIELPEYWISKTPVTNATFKLFVEETGHKTTAEKEGSSSVFPQTISVKGANWLHPCGPKTAIWAKMDHPVVQVSWHDAMAFAQWMGVGLQSKEQWEKAARGSNGLIYPWGNEWKNGRCNSHESGIRDTTSVGQFSPQGNSPYGCVDTCGNVWEWTTSLHDYLKSRRVLRGGSMLGNHFGLRVTSKLYLDPYDRNFNVGFRVVTVRGS